jgi:hypothetical protein
LSGEDDPIFFDAMNVTAKSDAKHLRFLEDRLLDDDGHEGKGFKHPLELFQTPELWPGFTAKICFPLRSPNAAAIPEESIRHTEKGYIVFVPEPHRLDDGKTEWVARARVLGIGFRGEGWVEVRQGLHVGEQVVHRGAEAIEDGTPIKFGGTLK